ncbi:hypothetical protein [Pseudoalteromonas gelatinilytica]|uniref:Uncharacterized protein n=1 Tax=Pseudoalteromonas gelatinilytica TaxID=1703256 RepID=A0A3A3EZU6_9GAMM|nr:hypothetical protein [Pseudoalteromonas profundi]RJF33652.1 hypothetical protein D4741_17015 [Pseudoalteromonas profundi]
MNLINCDFQKVAGSKLLKALKKELYLNVGEPFTQLMVRPQKTFEGYQLDPATHAKAQAVLQYFSSFGCPISMLRLGRSLSPMNKFAGSILSDEFAQTYLIYGFRVMHMFKSDFTVRDKLVAYIASVEFRQSSELFLHYIQDKKLDAEAEVVGLALTGMARDGPSILKF